MVCVRVWRVCVPASVCVWCACMCACVHMCMCVNGMWSVVHDTLHLCTHCNTKSKGESTERSSFPPMIKGGVIILLVLCINMCYTFDRKYNYYSTSKIYDWSAVTTFQQKFKC